MTKIISVIGGLGLILAVGQAQAICTDINFNIQIDVHAKSGGKSQQAIDTDQYQGKDCFNNHSATTTVQKHIGRKAGNQSIKVKSYQDTLPSEHPLRKYGIKIKTPNIKKNINVQKEIILPDEAFQMHDLYKKIKKSHHHS